jgi:hypothetical protein
MNQRARHRAIRNIVGSILMSDLSKSEIYDIADELSFGGLGGELGHLLRDASQIIGDFSTDPYSHDISSPPRLWEVAHDMIQRRKISKKTVLEVMASIAPKLFGKNMPPNITTTGTMRQLLEWFFQTATPVQASRLVNFLSDSAQDPYLKGIVRRD